MVPKTNAIQFNKINVLALSISAEHRLSTFSNSLSFELHRSTKVLLYKNVVVDMN